MNTILDPGCGKGVWGEAARERHPKATITGIDVVDYIPPSYDEFYCDDFLTTDKFEGRSFELIIGNPPFKKAEEFIEEGYNLLDYMGLMLFLLRLNFLEGQKRAKSLWKQLPPAWVYVLDRRPSFTGNRKTDATAYMLAIWRKPLGGIDAQNGTQLKWLQWNYDDQ